MLFNSIQFLIFFPIVTLMYFLIPRRFKHIWLLIASYFFYMSWNPKYAVLIAISTLITYASGLLINWSGEKKDQKRAKREKNLWVALSFTSNLAILFFFKYFNFLFASLAKILSMFGIAFTTPTFDVILPVGISFYTFQALSYTMDVYRKEIKPEKNLARYALYVSFFPQLVAGPIERAKNLLHQMSDEEGKGSGERSGICNGTFDYERVKRGLLLMLWGLFMKMVIADRVAILVDQVFNNYQQYAGFEIAIAAVFFAIQIYCDFGGYSNIAIGAAQVMGFKLMDNFKQPYFATSIREFWRGWHISLSTWFRDYLYIPLGGNRKGKLRQYFNTLVTFLISGLWHGASWHYVVWGGLHGVYLVLSDIIKPLRNKLISVFCIKTDCFSYRFFQQVLTFILVDFAWIFFRADGTITAIKIIKNMFTSFNPWIFTDGSLYLLGLDSKDFGVAVFSILVLFLIDWWHEKGMKIRTTFNGQNLAFRWMIYFAAIFSIIILGIYGSNYDASAFIYFQF